jgi:hypothetical protein
MAESGNMVTNQRPETVHLNDLQRHVLAHTDGKRDQAELVDALCGVVGWWSTGGARGRATASVSARPSSSPWVPPCATCPHDAVARREVKIGKPPVELGTVVS